MPPPPSPTPMLQQHIFAIDRYGFRVAETDLELKLNSFIYEFFKYLPSATKAN